MMFRTATRADIRRILGDLDDLVVERMLETGASADEIAEAASVHRQDLDEGVVDYLPSSSRVVEVQSILVELDADDEDIGDLGIPAAIGPP